MSCFVLLEYSWNARIIFGGSTRGKAATGIQLVKPGMLKIEQQQKKSYPAKMSLVQRLRTPTLSQHYTSVDLL